MMTRVTCALLLVLSAILGVPSGEASSCGRVYPPKCDSVTPIERLKLSKAVFVGRVIEVREAEEIQLVRFSVSKSWKHVRASEVIVTNVVHHEGPYFRQDNSYLVYAYERGDKLLTGGCSGTVEVKHALKDIKQLDKWMARNKSQARAKS